MAEEKTMLSKIEQKKILGTNRGLTEALKSLSQEQIAGELAGEGITKYFNPTSCPDMGGKFESMVKRELHVSMFVSVFSFTPYYMRRKVTIISRYREENVR